MDGVLLHGGGGAAGHVAAEDVSPFSNAESVSKTPRVADSDTVGNQRNEPTAVSSGGLWLSSESGPKGDTATALSGPASSKGSGLWTPTARAGRPVFGGGDTALLAASTRDADCSSCGQWASTTRKRGPVVGGSGDLAAAGCAETERQRAQKASGGLWSSAHAGGRPLFGHGDIVSTAQPRVLSRNVGLGGRAVSVAIGANASPSWLRSASSLVKTMDAASVRRELIRDGVVVTAPPVHTEELELPYEVHSINVHMCPVFSRLRRVTVEAAPPIAAESPSACALHLLLGVLAVRLPKVTLDAIRDMIPVPSCTVVAGAFRNGQMLVEVTLPQFVTRVGGGAFERCVHLGRVVLPNSSTRIR
jgi:hypothetical protein